MNGFFTNSDNYTVNGSRIDDRWNKNTLFEVLDGLRMYSVWWSLAKYDIITRYRRSVLGPLWITLSLGIFIGSMGVVYGTIFKIPLSTYLPYLTSGMVVWSFISLCINESCGIFIEGEPMIRNTRLPLSIFVYRMTARNLLIFLHNAPVIVIVILAFGSPINWNIFLLPISLFIVILNVSWLGLVLGLAATRYRDITQLIANIMGIVLFITPVMWNPSMMADRMYIVNINIIHHFIEIMRCPMLGTTPSMMSFLIVISTTIIGWLLALSTFHRFRSRIAYWL